VNCRSGRHRSCAVHSGTKSSTLPSVKSTPLSYISPIRRTPPTDCEQHPPWICSTSERLYGQHGSELSQTTGDVGRTSRYDDCGCRDDSESGYRLLYDETCTSRKKLLHTQSLLRASSQQHQAGGMSPSRAILLLGVD